MVPKTIEESTQSVSPQDVSDESISRLDRALTIIREIDQDIANLIQAWDSLPETARHNLRVVIRSTLGRHAKE